MDISKEDLQKLAEALRDTLNTQDEPAQKKVIHYKKDQNEDPSSPSFFGEFFFKLVAYFKNFALTTSTKIALPIMLWFTFFNFLNNWTAHTIGKLNPMALVFNNALQKLWIAGSYFVFINGFVLFFFLSSSTYFYKRTFEDNIQELVAHFNNLTSWQRVLFVSLSLFALALEFIMLLNVNLAPVLPDVQR